MKNKSKVNTGQDQKSSPGKRSIHEKLDQTKIMLNKESPESFFFLAQLQLALQENGDQIFGQS